MWPAAIALLLAIGVFIFVPNQSTMDRLTNLDLGATGFSDTYVMQTKTNASKAFVADRRDSTMRRSDRGQPGRKWDAFRFPGRGDTADGDIWLVKSKRKGKGTVFFVPAADVDDWVFPFLYTFVAERNEALGLPPLEWTNFYVNRIYYGLYLRVALPFDLRKKDGGSGTLRELITIIGGQSSHVNTRFEDSPGIFSDQVTESHFPQLAAPAPRLVWLAALNPVPGNTVLMSNTEPFDVSLLPLPIPLPDLFLALNERNASGYRDDRFNRWGEWPPLENAPFSDEELAELRQAFDVYAESLREAMRADGQFHQNLDFFAEQLSQRQAAGDALGLDLGGL